jgi:hypothetical protein
MSGHVDILRVVLLKWPKADCDEAFSIAFVKRDEPTRRVIGARSFVWTPLVVRLLERLPEREMERVCASYDLTEAAVTSEVWSRASMGGRIWSGVKARLLRGSATRFVVEAAAGSWPCAVLGAKWRGDAEFWSLVRALRLRTPSIERHGCRQGDRWSAKRNEFLKLAEARPHEECGMWGRGGTYPESDLYELLLDARDREAVLLGVEAEGTVTAEECLELARLAHTSYRCRGRCPLGCSTGHRGTVLQALKRVLNKWAGHEIC